MFPAPWPAPWSVVGQVGGVAWAVARHLLPVLVAWRSRCCAGMNAAVNIQDFYLSRFKVRSRTSSLALAHRMLSRRRHHTHHSTQWSNAPSTLPVGTIAQICASCSRAGRISLHSISPPMYGRGQRPLHSISLPMYQSPPCKHALIVDSTAIADVDRPCHSLGSTAPSHTAPAESVLA